MKDLLSALVLSLLCSFTSFAQESLHNEDGSGSVLLSNDQVEVVEYIGNPQGNVCGIGKHHHDAHLTVALTEARVLITTPDGEQQTAEIQSGAAIWFDAGIHSVVNEGNESTKFLLIYLKE